jgi:hypothetical protein
LLPKVFSFSPFTLPLSSQEERRIKQETVCHRSKTAPPARPETRFCIDDWINVAVAAWDGAAVGNQTLTEN